METSQLIIYIFQGPYAKILLILTVALVGLRINNRATNKILSKQKTARGRTLINTTSSAITIAVTVIVLLTVLSELGINIMPLLASAGVAGFAVGFASQSLIKDIINGIYMITADLFQEGDIVKVGGIEGKIEKITIRAITLRDIDGILHTVPNNLITTISNYTKEWARARILVGIANDHPIDEVLEIIHNEIEDMRSQEHWQKYMIDQPKLELADINGARTQISIRIKTKGIKQWDIEREVWYRLKKKFEEENIKFAG